jgi:hypothetical protein
MLCLDLSAGSELLMPATNDFLARLPVFERVNSSRADNDENATLIEPVVLVPAE